MIFIIIFCNLERDNFRIVPHIRKVYNGSSIVIPCLSFEPTRWYFKKLNENGEISSPFITKLKLKNIQLKNGGTYYCLGTKYKSGCSDNVLVHFLAEVFIAVYGKYIMEVHYCLERNEPLT